MEAVAQGKLGSYTIVRPGGLLTAPASGTAVLTTSKVRGMQSPLSSWFKDVHLGDCRLPAPLP